MPRSHFILEFSSFLELSSAFYPHFNMLTDDDSFHATPTFLAAVFIFAYHFDLGQSFLPS